jgi:MoxR-like ATPase
MSHNQQAQAAWATWLETVPADQREVLYELLRPDFAEESEVRVRITRSPTEELYVQNPPAFVDIFELHNVYRSIAFESNLLLKGPKGDGKSLSIIAYAAMNKIPLVIQECSEDTKKYDLQGSQFIIGQETVFSLGCIPTAIDVANETGYCILMLEEINALTPQVQKQLNAVTDFRKMCSIPHIGRTYRLQPGAQIWVVGTMNPTVYGGTYDLNEDLKSRFEEIEVTYPMHEQEKRILKSIPGPGLSDPQLDLLIRFARETRQQATGYALSTRDLDRLIRTVAKLGMDTALQLVLLKFEGADRKTVLGRMNSIFGDKKLRSFWGGPTGTPT